MTDETLEQNIQAIARTAREEKRELPLAQRIAGTVARFSGTVSFLVLHALLFGAWILWNLLSSSKFDPYPFTLLITAASLESIFLASFVLLAQNFSSEQEDKRHQLDLQINLLAEQESTALLRLLEKVAVKLGLPDEDLEEVRRLSDDVDPIKVLKKIQESVE